MNNFLKAYYDKYVLSVHALIVFTIYCPYLTEKIKLKVLACSFEITVITFENPSRDTAPLNTVMDSRTKHQQNKRVGKIHMR